MNQGKQPFASTGLVKLTNAIAFSWDKSMNVGKYLNVGKRLNEGKQPFAPTELVYTQNG